jgi:hypothetical protein
LLAAYPSLRAEDLVNAWNYARAHAAEIDAQIRENETLSGAILRELFGNVVEVTSLCGGREATQLHVLDETLSERFHIGSFGLEYRLLGITVLQSGGTLALTAAQSLRLPAFLPLSQPATAKRFSSLIFLRCQKRSGAALRRPYRLKPVPTVKDSVHWFQLKPCPETSH